jgi:predicted outer membrane repeat protein
MRRRLLAACALSFLAVPAGAVVRYVDADATGANDGTSWTNAFTSLQSALGAAISGDDLWVAAGIYKPTTTTDRTISFALKDGVRVLGGFAGTETMENQRNFVTNVTILSGDIGTVGAPGDNSFHVVTSGAGVTASGGLDGVHVTLGHANGAAASFYDRGGGIFINGSSPTIANCVITANSAQIERGGGIRVQTGSPLITRTRFTSNSAATDGGAIYAGTGSTVTLASVVVTGNTVVPTTAGAVTLVDNCLVGNSEIAANNANGIVLLGSGNQILNTTIASHGVGYGIACIGSITNTATNVILWGNGAGSIFALTAFLNVTYSDVQGGSAGVGNVSGDPLFRNAAAGDYRLLGGSPAVDSGNNAALPPAVTQDLGGLPRYFDDPAAPNTGAGTPPIIDMGAHERVPLTITGPTPASLTICEGDDAGFSVTAVGQAPLTYRWRRNMVDLADGGPISGSGTSSLTIDPAATAHAGTYDVRVMDGLGQVVLSSGATLIVGVQPAAPVVTAPAAVGAGSAGNVASVPMVAGSSWNWTVTGGTLTGGQGTRQITFTAGAAGTTIQLSVVETTAASCVSPAGQKLVSVDFLDVGPTHPFRAFVNTLVRNAVTSGCGSGNYCPDFSVLREQMAIFLLRSKEGAAYTPPACTMPVFADVPCSSPFAIWINELVARSVTAGCGGGNYCPASPVTREQMAVFLLVTLEGSSYLPPACVSPSFSDVPCSSGFARWIEELVRRGITAGCGGGNYCPASPVTRGQMAVFLVATFSLT